MVVEIIAGVLVGGVVGYYVTPYLIKYERKQIIKRAKKKILKQDLIYSIKTDPRQYRAEEVDLKAIINDPNYQYPIITPRPIEKKKEDPKTKIKSKKKNILKKNEKNSI